MTTVKDLKVGDTFTYEVTRSFPLSGREYTEHTRPLTVTKIGPARKTPHGAGYRREVVGTVGTKTRTKTISKSLLPAMPVTLR